MFHSDFILTDQQQKLLKKNLNSFEPQILARGAEVFWAKGVRSITWKLPDALIEAVVIGTKPYTVTILLHGGTLDITCDCPYEFACKHAAAVILALTKNASFKDVPPDDDSAVVKPVAKPPPPEPVVM